MFADADDDHTQVLSRAQMGLDAVTLVPPPPDRGLRFVITYKFVRSGIALALAIGIAAIIASGRADSVVMFFVNKLRQHASSGLSAALARALLKAVVPGRLWLIVGAFTLDAVITGIEGFALRTGRRWGEWLVVVATGIFVPFEIVALWRDPHFGRALLLLFNTIIAVYLLVHVLKEERRLRALNT
jgi:uncharacterized membrane protein (DUF2068 family)